MKHALFLKYLKILVWFCSCCLLTVAIINHTIDPEKINAQGFDNEKLSFVDQLVGSSHGLFVDLKFHNLRDIRRAHGLYPTTAECTVIGSSRVWQISSVRTEKSLTNTCSSIINLGVDGGSLEDFLAFSEITLRNKKAPKTIIFGVDPWSFNFYRNREWKRLEPDYKKMKSRLSSTHGSYGDGFFDTASLLDLLNLRNLMASVAYILRNGETPKKRLLNKEGPGLYDVILPDGSLLLRPKLGKTGFADIHWANNKIYSEHNYDKEAIKLFTRLVLYLQQRFKVVFLLVPYHPLAIDAQLQPLTTAITLIEPIVHQIARSVGAQVIGSYKPDSIGCKADGFMDALHPRSKCTMKLETLSVQYKTINKKQLLK
jgi:hypothetical protein